MRIEQMGMYFPGLGPIKSSHEHSRMLLTSLQPELLPLASSFLSSTLFFLSRFLPTQPFRSHQTCSICPSLAILCLAELRLSSEQTSLKVNILLICYLFIKLLS